MAKDKNWLVSFFDDTTSKPVKRTSSQLSKAADDPIELFNNYNDSRKKQNTINLSTLLAKCEPTKSSELVVSRQKQQEVSSWLSSKARAGKPAAAVVSGPSGCGKTSAIKVLAKEHNFNVIEWTTPIDEAPDEYNRVTRQGDKFEEYLIRATRYNSVLGNQLRRLSLVKDFPNIYFWDKESFYNLLDKYFQMGKEPVVFVCSDSNSSRTLQTLFPEDIREKYNIDHININPITQASMKNALKRISGIFNAVASHFLHVSQDNIDETLSNNIGDIRSAIWNLIFTSLKVPEVEEKSDCGLREEGLGLLHGIGRVTNPKRIADGDTWKFVHDPDDIAAYFQSQATIFVHFLHENYLNTMGKIEEIDKAADILSFGDVLNSEWRDINLNKITLSFCIRGIMVTNEKPVTGWNPVRKPRQGHPELRRDLADAEFRWYSSIIDPSKTRSKITDPENETEVIIE